jgi:hypothetical protein
MNNKPVFDFSEFRSDDDFATFVADIQDCKESGERFFMCKESALNRAFSKIHLEGTIKGYLTGFVASLIFVGVLSFFKGK